MSEYESTVEQLAERIEALIPDYPHILEITSSWDLFKISKFTCEDLGPSLAQAAFALRQAKQNYRKKQINSEQDTGRQGDKITHTKECL